MEKKYVVPLKDAVTGVLHGGGGTFRILIDQESSGAKYFSCLVNTMNKGVKGSEHKHDVEHLWYILSGRERCTSEGRPMRSVRRWRFLRPQANYTGSMWGLTRI